MFQIHSSPVTLSKGKTSPDSFTFKSFQHSGAAQPGKNNKVNDGTVTYIQGCGEHKSKGASVEISVPLKNWFLIQVAILQQRGRCPEEDKMMKFFKIIYFSLRAIPGSA